MRSWEVMGIVRLVVAVFAVLIGGGVALYFALAAQKQQKPHLVFENATGAEVEIALDGKALGKVAAGAGKVFQVTAGSHQVTAGAEKATITVPDKVGYRGLYTVGGSSRLAVVTVYYSTSPGGSVHDDKVEPVELAKGEHLTALPDSMAIDAMEIDKPFADTIDVPQGALDVSVTHLCHFQNDEIVGCPGFHLK